MSTPPSRREPSEEDLRNAPVLPGFELPDHVTMGRGVVLGDGLEPEDIGVVAFLKLRDPRRPATQADLAREMQAHGWKMGKARFAAVFQRLKAAGHIKHSPAYNPETGRPEWRIEFFLNPANNDQYVNSGISAFPQVGAENPETGVSQVEQLFENPETGVSRGQKESPVFGNPEANPRKTGFPSADVLAGQGRISENRVFGSTPPHPPEGGGNTTPSPHKTGRAAKWEAACALHADDYQPTAEETKEANSFLQDLPGKWQMNVDQARDLAPLLASRLHELGLEMDTLLEIELMADDPKDPVRLPSRVMPTRIRNLKRRQTEGERQAQPASGLAAWCGKCNRGEFPMAVYQRTVEVPNGNDEPCKECHPKYARA